MAIQKPPIHRFKKGNKAASHSKRVKFCIRKLKQDEKFIDGVIDVYGDYVLQEIGSVLKGKPGKEKNMMLKALFQEIINSQRELAPNTSITVFIDTYKSLQVSQQLPGDCASGATYLLDGEVVADDGDTHT